MQIAELPADPGRALSTGHLGDGSKWLITAEDVSRGIARLYLSRRGSAEATPVSVEGALRALGLECRLVPRLSVDASGNAWLPAACRQGQEVPFALIRASPEGGVMPIALRPPVEARWVTVDPHGTLFVLGIEAGFFRGRTQECHLVHQYTATGERVRSFSPCPVTGAAGVGPTRRDGVDFEALKPEADYGKLWLQDSNIHQLLPQAGEMRIYSTDGTLIRTVSFERPAAPAGQGYVIHALFPLGGEKYLVFWRSNVREGGSVKGTSGAAVHGLDGRMLTALAGPAQLRGLLPAYVNAQGELLFHRVEAATGRITLWRAGLSLNEPGVGR